MSKISNKTWIAIIAIAVLVASGTTAYFKFWVPYHLTRVMQFEFNDTTYLYITPEDDAESVRKKIEDAGGAKAGEAFALYAEHNNYNNKKRSGKFELKSGDTMRDIYNRIVSNTQAPVKLTVPSTRDLNACVGTICRQLMIDSTELSEYTNSDAYIMALGYTRATFPSLFIPDTYEVYWDISAENLMIKLMKEHTRFWNDSRTAKAKALGMTKEQVSTLASIVDEETNNTAEQPTVAGLYINRLKKGMPLQADPTVKFALGDFARTRILKKDLETESPYNTYKNKGLPPGPIRIPTKQALEAVLNYEKHNYLYMCAKEDFSGTHNFAKTLNEHNTNAKRYQQALNKRKIMK